MIGIVYGVINGTIGEVNAAIIESAKEAVNLCLTMLGVMSFWTGLMAVAKSIGLLQGMERLLRPVLRFLFPNVPAGHPAAEYITSNITANILGLGWAATPFGLKAMEELKNLEEEREKEKEKKVLSSSTSKAIARKPSRTEKRSSPDVASDEMCTFLIINISSLQLIPVNVIAYRSQYGSANPTGIIGVSIVVTLFSTMMAVVFCKVMQIRKGKSFNW